MRRREFIALLGGAAAWPVATWAQQLRALRRIGILNPESTSLAPLPAFLDELIARVARSRQRALRYPIRRGPIQAGCKAGRRPGSHTSGCDLYARARRDPGNC